MNFDKIFPAILIASITAMLGGFIAKKIVHPHDLKKDAVAIDGEVVAAGGAEAGPTGPEPILALMAAADIARGEKLSKACAACHGFDQGGVNKVGPNLWGVVNAKKGIHDGYAYSEALIAKGGTWSYDSLNQFLWKPKSYIDGTKMNFAGLKKPEDRAALIAWLRTLAASPAALPSEAEIAAEAVANAPPPVVADPAAAGVPVEGAVAPAETPAAEAAAPAVVAPEAKASEAAAPTPAVAH